MIDSSPAGSQVPNPPKHQPDRVDVGTVAGLGLALIALVLVSMVGMVIFFRGLEVADEKSLPYYAVNPQGIEPPPPQLDPSQSQQLRDLRAEHHRILSSYEWIDEDKGIARIPIDRAVELLADHLPARNDNE